MNIIVLHGDHTEKTYERLGKFVDSAKKRGWKVERLDGEKVKSISDELTSQSLFGEESLFVLTNFSGLAKHDQDWVKKESGDIDGTLVIVETKTMHSATLKSLPTSKVEKFELDKSIWKFLDSFYPGNAKVCIALLHKTIETEAPEFVFALLGGLTKDLYLTRVGPSTMNMPSWKLGKLKSQSDRFTDEGIKVVIAKLSDIDYRSKTSKVDTKSELELLISTDLV